MIEPHTNFRQHQQLVVISTSGETLAHGSLLTAPPPSFPPSSPQNWPSFRTRALSSIGELIYDYLAARKMPECAVEVFQDQIELTLHTCTLCVPSKEWIMVEWRSMSSSELLGRSSIYVNDGEVCMAEVVALAFPALYVRMIYFFRAPATAAKRVEDSTTHTGFRRT